MNSLLPVLVQSGSKVCLCAPDFTVLNGGSLAFGLVSVEQVCL